MTDDLPTRLLEAIEDFRQHEPDADLVLRLCQAHREIVELHRHERRTGYDSDEDQGGYGVIYRACTSCGSQDLAVRWPCETLRTLATAYGIEVTP